MNRADLRSVPRYFLTPSLPAIADSRLVRLVDLSVKGARVETDEALQIGQDLSLVLVTDRGHMKLTGTVLWCQVDTLLMDAEDRYLSGVAFTHAVAGIDVLLDELCGREQAIRIEDSRSYDRYRITAPLTAQFANVSPVSLLDISLTGAKIAIEQKVAVGATGDLLFQIDDETGPMSLFAEVMWTVPAVASGSHAGLRITGGEDALRTAIHRLCLRGEARIDLDSLRRKFDQLRTKNADPLLREQA